MLPEEIKFFSLVLYFGGFAVLLDTTYTTAIRIHFGLRVPSFTVSDAHYRITMCMGCFRIGLH